MKEVLLKILDNCFPVNFAKLLRTPFLQVTSRWLLLLQHFTDWLIVILGHVRLALAAFPSSCLQLFVVAHDSKNNEIIYS